MDSVTHGNGRGLWIDDVNCVLYSVDRESMCTVHVRDGQHSVFENSLASVLILSIPSSAEICFILCDTPCQE